MTWGDHKNWVTKWLQVSRPVVHNIYVYLPTFSCWFFMFFMYPKDPRSGTQWFRGEWTSSRGVFFFVLKMTPMILRACLFFPSFIPPGNSPYLTIFWGGYGLLEDELRQVLCGSLGVGFPQLSIRLLTFGFVRPKFSECCRSHEELLLFTHIHTYHIYIYV